MHQSVRAGQHEQRNLARGPGLELADVGIERDQRQPQLGPGGPASSSARTVNVSLPTSTVILGLALRL